MSNVLYARHLGIELPYEVHEVHNVIITHTPEETIPKIDSDESIDAFVVGSVMIEEGPYADEYRQRYEPRGFTPYNGLMSLNGRSGKKLLLHLAEKGILGKKPVLVIHEERDDLELIQDAVREIPDIDEGSVDYVSILGDPGVATHLDLIIAWFQQKVDP
tara:strand:- start:810 stop:1289 length:480 start_codon:yes stop_codon:yes gene_type:complete